MRKIVNKIVVTTTFLLSIGISQACTNLPAPFTQVLGVDNGTFHLETTLGTKQTAFSYGFLDNIDLPNINKYKTLEELVMSNFVPLHQKNHDLHIEAGKIIDTFLRKATMNRDIDVHFSISDSYLKHGEHLSRNPITISQYGIHADQKSFTDLGDDLVAIGYAKDYYGGPREKWTKEELLHIINSHQPY